MAAVESESSERASMATTISRKRTKEEWRSAIGASKKPRRLHLKADRNGFVYCPVSTCDHSGFRTVRGCRKHTAQQHGWWFFFTKRPQEKEVFPKKTGAAPACAPVKSGRASTVAMPSFDSTCSFSKNFSEWLQSDWGGSKSSLQAQQVARRVLKFLRFCYPDQEPNWEVCTSAIDSSITCTKQITRFMCELKETWNLRYSACIGYLNSLADAIDYRKCCGAFASTRDILDVVDVLLTRTRRSLARKMRVQWNTLLDIDFLAKQNCWASLSQLQSVLPYHLPRFTSIIQNAKDATKEVGPNDLSFATHFLAAMLFLDVKATRPMTYQHLTLGMINSIEGQTGMIDQTQFKTCQRYGFDSLIFEEQHLSILRAYISHVRPRLSPSLSQSSSSNGGSSNNSDDFLLVTRHGKMLSNLSSMLGNLVHQATGKYIHPTRLRQIIETESASKLSTEQQSFVSEDQKHTSHVARVSYQKMRSRDVAIRAKEALATLGKTSSLARADLQSLQPVSAFSAEKEVKTEEEESAAPLLAASATKVRFTKEEDLCLKNGIIRYGWGAWSAILRDKDYHFHRFRCRQTLYQRAVRKRMKFI